MAGSEYPGRKIRIWLTGRFGEMRLAGMGTSETLPYPPWISTIQAFAQRFFKRRMLAQ